MKKKILFGALAAVLVALNVLAFSSFTASAKVAPADMEAPAAGGRCYQTMGYCSAWHLNYSCTTSSTSESCRRYVCSNC